MQKGGSIAQAKDRLILMDRLGNIFSFKNNKIVKENLKVPNNIDKFIYNYKGKILNLHQIVLEVTQ